MTTVFILVGLILFSTSIPAYPESRIPEINRQISVGTGVFGPFEGKAGGMAIVQFLFLRLSHFRIGGEIEFRDFDADLLDVENVNTQSLFVRGIAKYYLNTEGLSPYVGGGLGYSINRIDDDKIKQNRPGIRFESDTGPI